MGCTKFIYLVLYLPDPGFISGRSLHILVQNSYNGEGSEHWENGTCPQEKGTVIKKNQNKKYVSMLIPLVQSVLYSFTPLVL